MGSPICGTPAESYLRSRRISLFNPVPNLRFHPRCYYRCENGGPALRLPAMLAAITVLSVRTALPEMATLAGLSAAHLTAIQFPEGLRRLYVLRDRDQAGAAARDTLCSRAEGAGIEALTLTPRLGDFNDDLRRYGVVALQERLRLHLHLEDAARFLAVRGGTGR